MHHKLNKSRQITIGIYLVLINFFFHADPSLGKDADDLTTYCSTLYEPNSSSNNFPKTISLCEALTLAIKVNPELAALILKLESIGGRIIQANLTPNPSLDASVENVGPGTKRSDAEFILQWSQLFERGDKRNKREDLAKSEKELAALDYQLKRSDIIQEVSLAFMSALTSKEKLSLANQRKLLAQEFLQNAKRRVFAGKDSNIERVKAKLALSNSEIALDQVTREFETSQRKLAFYLGLSSDKITLQGKIDQFPPPPRWLDLEKALPNSPDMVRVRLEANKRKSTLLLAKANAIADFTLSGGLRHFLETDKTALTFGISVPVPISNRNQGTILEATNDLDASNFEEKSEMLKKLNELQDAYQDMLGAFSRATRFKIEVLPIADQALDGANNAYFLGKLNYLDVLDAQKTLFGAQEDYLEAITTYYTARSNAERLLGRSIVQLASIKSH